MRVVPNRVIHESAVLPSGLAVPPQVGEEGLARPVIASDLQIGETRASVLSLGRPRPVPLRSRSLTW